MWVLLERVKGGHRTHLVSRILLFLFMGEEEMDGYPIKLCNDLDHDYCIL